ncbi:MAG: hypothetical protein NUW37_09120 [Planctomycetes bacterium]|nr:hypothetical protein [Planctomycetota bacterium]
MNNARRTYLSVILTIAAVSMPMTSCVGDGDKDTNQDYSGAVTISEPPSALVDVVDAIHPLAAAAFQIVWWIAGEIAWDEDSAISPSTAKTVNDGTEGEIRLVATNSQCLREPKLKEDGGFAIKFDEAGTYRLEYVSGAWSAWPDDDYAPNYRAWSNTVDFIHYRGESVLEKAHLGTSHHTAESAEQAEASGSGHHREFTVREGDVLLLYLVAYNTDNRGGVVLRLRRVQ